MIGTPATCCSRSSRSARCTAPRPAARSADAVRLESRVESLDELDADAVILAVPAPEAARLLGEEPPALEDSPIVSVHLLFDRPILPHRLAALLDSPAHWVFDRGALTGHQPPDGGQYLTVVSSGVPDLLEIRGKGLVDLMADSLTGRLGPAELLWSRVCREPRATFAARPGTRRLRWHMRTSRENVYLAGAWIASDWPATMEAAVRSGVAAAKAAAAVSATETLTRLDTAVEKATARLLELQHPGGWWVGELESNATMIAEHLFWLHVLGLRDPDTDRRLANDLLARRRDDGTWSNWFEGPADLSTTIESYVALKMAGVDPGRRTLDYIRREGGIARSRVFTKCFMALLGHWPWQRIVADPARADPAPAERAVLDLQLRLLGAADGRAALGRLGAPPGAPRRPSTSARSAPVPARRSAPCARARSAAARSPPPSAG